MRKSIVVNSNKNDSDYNFGVVLLEKLKENVISFDFIKADNSVRKMLGTRNSAIIGKYLGSENSNSDLENDVTKAESDLRKDLIVIFDIESKSFKSFKPSRVLKKSINTLSIVGDNYIGEEVDVMFDLKHDIVKMLIKGEVDLIFAKKDGSLREMRGSRHTSSHEIFKDLNKNNEILKEINKGTISVFDTKLGELRKFNFSRLLQYKLPDDDNYIDFELNADLITDLSDELSKVSNIFNPRKFKTEEIINILKNKVVRLVFRKKGTNEIRVLYGTRNTDLIETYGKVGVDSSRENDDISSAEKIQAQVDGDVVRVFDLAKREFRSFKPSTLLSYDIQNGVCSWVEFDIEDDGWFETSLQNKPIKNYVGSYNRYASTVGVGNAKRAEFETKQKDLTVARNEIKGTDIEDSKERYEIALGKVNSILKEINATLTTSDLEKFNQMSLVFDSIKSKFEANESSSRLLSGSSLSASKKLISFKFNLGKDIFIIHPLFILNAVSHKVYVDRTGLLSFDSVRRSNDEKYKSLLIPFLKLVGGRRKKDRFNIPFSENDIRRVEKLKLILSNNKSNFEKIGINYGLVKDKAENELIGLSIEMKGRKTPRKLIISPAYIYDVSSKEIIYERRNAWATNKEFNDFLLTNPKVLGLEPSRAITLLKAIRSAWYLGKGSKGKFEG